VHRTRAGGRCWIVNQDSWRRARPSVDRGPQLGCGLHANGRCAWQACHAVVAVSGETARLEHAATAHASAIAARHSVLICLPSQFGRSVFFVSASPIVPRCHSRRPPIQSILKRLIVRQLSVSRAREANPALVPRCKRQAGWGGRTAPHPSPMSLCAPFRFHFYIPISRYLHWRQRGIIGYGRFRFHSELFSPSVNGLVMTSCPLFTFMFIANTLC
jgi:hypothetical protein